MPVDQSRSCLPLPAAAAALIGPSALAEKQSPLQTMAQLLWLDSAWRHTSHGPCQVLCWMCRGYSAAASSTAATFSRCTCLKHQLLFLCSQISCSALSYQNICHFVFNSEVTLWYRIWFPDVLRNFSIDTSRNKFWVTEKNKLYLWQSTNLTSDTLRYFFLFKDKYFSAEVTISMIEFFLSRKNCDSTQLSLLVLGITVMGSFQKHCGVLTQFS